MGVTARTAAGLALCLTLVVTAGRVAISAQINPSARTLVAASSVDDAFAPGEAHPYTIDLIAGEYLSFSVLQQGIDVVVTVRGPDAIKLVEVDGPTGMYGSERVRLIATTSGPYRIDVRSLEKDVPAGRYRLDVHDLRVARDEDRRRIEAQTAYLSAIQFRLQSKADSLLQAIDKYEEAARLWRSVSEVAEEAAAENDLAYAYRLLSDYPRAFDYYQRALDLRQQAGDGPGEAQTLTNLGALCYLLGENQRALDYYLRALPLRRAEDNFQEQALLLSNMGEVFALWSEHQKALDYFREALPAERKVGDRLRESLTLSNIGRVYTETGQNHEALQFFEAALTAARASGNRRVEARILDSSGGAYRDLGDTVRALASYEQALSLQRSAGDRLGESETLNATGVILMQTGDDQKALELYRQSLSLQESVGNRRDQAGTLNNIAAVMIRRGALDEALAALEQSLSLCRAVQDRRGEAQSLYGLARVYRFQGKLPAALSSGEAALEIVEALRTKLVSQEMRASYFASSLEMYEFVTATLMEANAASPDSSFAVRAFHVSERARARALLDGLIEAQGGVRRGISDELRARERNLQDRINARAERQIQLLSGAHTTEAADGASREMDALLTELQELEAEIRTRSPRYADLTRPRPLDALAVQQQVLDADTLLLEYALGAERSFLWVLAPGSFDSYVLPSRSEIEHAAQRFYHLLTARNEEPPGETAAGRRRRVTTSDGELDAAAGVLSQMLLGPIGQRLESKRLLIVSDGGLQYVPFGALPDPARDRAAAPEPLIVKHEIVLSPSASALAVLRSERPDASRRAGRVAIIADPVFSADDPRLSARANQQTAAASSQTRRNTAPAETDVVRSGADIGISGFRRLRFSRDEADTIASLTLPGERFEALDFQASRTTVMTTDFSGYGVVHFSTHGLLNNVHPELSGLVLSLYDEHGTPQDGFLRLHDIYNLTLDADVVVLSACGTALGREIRGEGLIGLARGFMYAGTSRVVASLWNVEDQATAGLMKEFYQRMLAGKESPAAALRAAQISIWQGKRWHASYYWAAFALQGEWR